MLFFTAAMIESMHKPLIDMSPAHAMSAGWEKGAIQAWRDGHDERGEDDGWVERSDSAIQAMGTMSGDKAEGIGLERWWLAIFTFFRERLR
jgi:hypothetical protein